MAGTKSPPNTKIIKEEIYTMPKTFDEADLKQIGLWHKLMSADSDLASDEAVKNNERPRLEEVLTTDTAKILMPEVITLVAKEAAEPEYIGTRLLKPIRATAGNSYQFPVTGAIRAFKIPETGEYPEQDLDFEIYGGPNTVKIEKYGVRVRISEEAINDSLWDVVGMNVRAGGSAMARKKEENIFNEFSKHGHVVFDNALRSTLGEMAGTTGLDYAGNLNDTLSTLDLLHMATVLIHNGFTPTDIIMNPLCIPLFAQNEFIRAYTGGAFGGITLPDGKRYVQNPTATNSPSLGGINVICSPMVPFNKDTKRFDLYMVDRNNVGVLLIGDELKTEQFNDPLRDILNIKFKERYGIGLLYEGRGVAVAKNIAYARSWEAPERVFQTTVNENAMRAFDRLIG